MSLHDVWQLVFDFLPKKPVCVEPVDENLSTDAGLLVFRQWDEQQRFTEGFAEQLDDLRRDPEHTTLEMVRSRLFGILAGYEDQNDHDALRSDAIFKLLANRSPEDDDLASQPTLSRFENSIPAKSLLRLEDWFLERFVNSFDEPPREVTLDIDVFDDPTHGDQQLTFFHGYYKQYQYLVRAITCAENDADQRCASVPVLPVLLYGTADVAWGLAHDVERIVRALREKFPHVLIRVRADAGYAKPWFYRLCERLDIEYSIGLGMNAVLKRNSEAWLEKAVEQYEQTGQPQRLFTGFDYQAGTWEQPRWVVLKCEAHAQGTNRRRPPQGGGARSPTAPVLARCPKVPTTSTAGTDRRLVGGESENRNKELKCELCADRLSDHRYLANCFRLFLHCWANNLLVSLRQKIADPPTEEDSGNYLDPATVPVEARTGRARRRHFNRRREADPLGEGHACTWRMRLIKVAARIQVTARCVRVLLSGSWPYLDHFRDVGQALMKES